ncbi:hypothetical protein [Streptacidiphilus fuscans]|uniref:Uncharacterized protein n=1 Tax=Streptacidiphilus fuscans TaxID=2789292 RepID=A0A931BEB1_9ACTN|nr:hypothetical protein [Streptacidiphilus fuscans]MBF9071880.1 hypothetical protein [Streptacidiphilus fuscans]
MSTALGDWIPADLLAVAGRLPLPYRAHTMTLTVRRQDAAGTWAEVSRREVSARTGDSTQALAFPPCACPHCSGATARPGGR